MIGFIPKNKKALKQLRSHAMVSGLFIV